MKINLALTECLKSRFHMKGTECPTEGSIGLFCFCQFPRQGLLLSDSRKMYAHLAFGVCPCKMGGHSGCLAHFSRLGLEREK